MIVTGEAIAAAAASLVGVKFRLHGRNPETGLDCVGVVATSMRLAGARPAPPMGYTLRNNTAEPFFKAALASGLYPTKGVIKPGDVLMVRPGPAQLHLLVAAPNIAFVHADAALRRVTLLSSPLTWAIQEHWRYRQLK